MHGDHAAAGSATKGSAAPPPTPGMLSGSWKLRHCTACTSSWSRVGTDTALGRHRRSSCRSSCRQSDLVQRSLCPLLAPRPPLVHSLQVIWTFPHPPKKRAGLWCWLVAGGRGQSPWAGRRKCALTVEMERSLRGSYCEICAVERLTQPRRVGLPVTTSLRVSAARRLSVRPPPAAL